MLAGLWSPRSVLCTIWSSSWLLMLTFQGGSILYRDLHCFLEVPIVIDSNLYVFPSDLCILHARLVTELRSNPGVPAGRFVKIRSASASRSIRTCFTRLAFSTLRRVRAGFSPGWRLWPEGPGNPSRGPSSSPARPWRRCGVSPARSSSASSSSTSSSFFLHPLRRRQEQLGQDATAMG